VTPGHSLTLQAKQRAEGREGCYSSLCESGIDVLVDGGDGVTRIETDTGLLVTGDACVGRHGVVCTQRSMLSV
jgi:hypothetical protein